MILLEKKDKCSNAESVIYIMARASFFLLINIKTEAICLPKKTVAFNGVPVEGCTLANQDGTNLALPITQRYLAWPSMATKREATMPKLAPAPTRLLAQLQPILRKAIENDAFSDIYITPAISFITNTTYIILYNMMTKVKVNLFKPIYYQKTGVERLHIHMTLSHLLFDILY